MARATQPKQTQNGKPLAVEKPRIFELVVDDQEIGLLASMLQQVTFPDPMSKHVAANLQVKIERLVSENGEA